MPSYKLLYFNGRGRGEIARMIFAQAGVEYEDVRIEFSEWANLKKDRAKFPMGQMPTLEVDGSVLFQSHVINRYLAREFRLAGKDSKEMATVDLVCETCSDMFSKIIEIKFAKDEAVKAEKLKAFQETGSELYLYNFNRVLEKNDGGKKYIVGKAMTAADIYLLNGLEGVEACVPGVVAKYPLLQAFCERMKNEPKIAAWIAKRPKTEF